MPTFYEISFNVTDWEFKRRRVSLTFFDFDTAREYSRKVSECEDVDERHVDVIDATTGEVVATYNYGQESYNNW